MKKLSEYTAKEKIKAFNVIYRKCVDSLNNALELEDMLDETIAFREDMITEVVGLTKDDWKENSEGHYINPTLE